MVPGQEISVGLEIFGNKGKGKVMDKILRIYFQISLISLHLEIQIESNKDNKGGSDIIMNLELSFMESIKRYIENC